MATDHERPAEGGAEVRRHHAFHALRPTSDPLRFQLLVEPELSAHGAGRHFLMGGVGLAAAIDAMEAVTGRALIWAAAQFVSYAAAGEIVDLDVSVPAVGRNISQARVLAHVDEREVFAVTGALGGRDDHQHARTFVDMPDVAAPHECAVIAPEDPDLTTLHRRLEQRRVPTPDAQADGTSRVWMRTQPQGDVTAGLIAVLADFLPGGTRQAIDQPLTTNSLDNTLRIHTLAQTEWVLLDTRITGVRSGFFHGDMRLFSEAGALLATANQSGIVRLD